MWALPLKPFLEQFWRKTQTANEKYAAIQCPCEQQTEGQAGWCFEEPDPVVCVPGAGWLEVIVKCPSNPNHSRIL